MTDLADRPELRRLWAAAHRRLEQTGGRIDGVRAVVPQPSADERQAVDRLLGVRSRGRSLRVTLGSLDALLRERLDMSLTEIVAATCGPLRDRPAERMAVADADRRLWTAAERHPATGRHPELGGWFDHMRVTGRLRRIDDPTRRLREALDVLEHLPTPERAGRARLAATVLGDSHALDDSAPTGRLVLSALMHLAGAEEGPIGAGERRQLWADQGVALDETSSTVLTLGLHPVVVGPLTDAAHRWADAGVPLPVPLAAVSAERWRVPEGTLVSVCENATVVEAAAACFGVASPTMVCVEGNPSLAARRFLASLADSGARLRYHGDFGTGGLAIGNVVIGELGAVPWRFDAAAHANALAIARSAGRSCRPLAGHVPPARWDVDLAPAIERSGVEVEEEQVLGELLADLHPGKG